MAKILYRVILGSLFLLAAPGAANTGLLAAQTPGPATKVGGKSAVKDSQPAPEQVNAAIDRALKGESRFHLVAECLSEGDPRSVELFGPVGVWGNRRQFRLETAQTQALLKKLKEAGFAEMKEIYGGNEPDGGEFAKRISCRIEFGVDDLRKSSNQFQDGKQSKELRALAESILAFCEKPGKKGVSAESLSDGLGKIRRAELDPISLLLVCNRKPDRKALASGVEGWLLVVEGGLLKVRRYSASRGVGAEAVRPLSGDELLGLASLLEKNRFTELPINLYAEHYTDLNAELLGRREGVQAREFAGMSPKSHPKEQRHFDAIIHHLAKLAQSLRK